MPDFSPEREHFQAILDTLEEAVMTVDRDLTVQGFNRAAADLTGYLPGEAIGRKCYEVCQGSRCQSHLCPVLEAYRTEQIRRNDAMIIRTRQGEERPVQVNTGLLRSEEGRIIGGIETFRVCAATREQAVPLPERCRFARLVGKSAAMQEIYRLIELISDSSATVLLQGETGTGKELVAEAIHYHSPRANGPLIKVNCAALPDTLLETELFGHVRGAFTDAVADRPGRFELAQGGTLLLDEISEIGPKMQAKLLRVCESGEFERLGEGYTRRADVRLIVATNRNLSEEVAAGRFREDLFYRLNVIPISLPPLRERREDIPLLIEHCLAKLRRATGRPVRTLDPDALRLLLAYPWPGNVRELENTLEYAVLVCRDTVLRASDLPPRMGGASVASLPMAIPDEKTRLLQALQATHGHIRKCAELLGVDRTTVWRKMKRYRLEKPR